MNLSPHRLAQRLGAELGASAVSNLTAERAGHRVDGKPPALICWPASSEQVAAALRICSEEKAAVTPWGGGTAMSLGNPPKELDVVIVTARLNRLLEHDHANLTATVESGIVLADLQKALAPKNHFAPFDPPFSEHATIGGIVAANLNGPRRSCYGNVRDLVIGIKVALAGGEQIKAGGKVVKNVAGYDMCKLFVGSLGTLGIITEVTLRMATTPECAKTVSAAGALAQALQFVDDLSRSPLLPAAVSLTNLGTDNDLHNWRAAVLCEGFNETVTRHVADIETIARRIGIEAGCLTEENSSAHWQQIRDLPLRRDALIFRVTVPRLAVAQVVNAIGGWSSAGFALGTVIDTTAGVIWIAALPKQAAAEQFPKLITLAQQQGGHAVMFAAPPELKTSIDVWGPPPPALPLMRELKRQFDPSGILNPDRFLRGV